MIGQEYVLGVDVGGTNIKLSGMNRECIPQRVVLCPTPACQSEITESIYNAIEEYIEEKAKKPAAIGIGLVGHVNSKDGIWENAINIKITKPVNIRGEILSRFGVPVFIDNDVRMATRAEMSFGAGKTVNDFIYINIGTGIAAGIVSGGRIVGGVCNYAGEIGHMAYGDQTRLCKCGRKGCLEPSVSGGGMVAIAKEEAAQNPISSFAGVVNGESINAGIIYREAKRGDPLAIKITEAAMHSLECAVTDLVNLLNPALIIFGGGAILKEFILKRLTGYVYKNALPVAARGLIGIKVSELDPALLGLIGAGCAAWLGLEDA